MAALPKTPSFLRQRGRGPPRRQLVPFYLLSDQPDKQLFNLKLEIHKRVQDELVPSTALCNSIIHSVLGNTKKTSPLRRRKGNLKLLGRQQRYYLDNFTEGGVVFDRNLDSGIRVKSSGHTPRGMSGRNASCESTADRPVRSTAAGRARTAKNYTAIGPVARRPGFTLQDLKSILH